MSLILISMASVASARIPQQPLASVLRITTHVMFAPPEIRGTYNTVVTKDGLILKIDNKGNKSEIAKLSPAAVASLLGKIEEVQPGELVKEGDGPGCLDVPTTNTFVVKANGSEVHVIQNANCQFSALESAWEVREIAESIENLAHILR